MVKNLSANAGEVKDAGSIPGLGRCHGGRNGTILQYFCLENPVDRGAWQLPSMGLHQLGTSRSSLILLAAVIVF